MPQKYMTVAHVRRTSDIFSVFSENTMVVMAISPRRERAELQTRATI
jgi:hypothetical protein